MPLWTGSFAKSGSPVLKITVSGPLTQGMEYEAILDTGFTGFLSMPLIEAIRNGLVLHGTTTVSFADGSSDNYRLTAQGQVKVDNESKIGVVVLEPSSRELLLGMAFLRQFGKVLVVAQNRVLLQDQGASDDALEAGKDAEAIQAASAGAMGASVTLPPKPPSPPAPRR